MNILSLENVSKNYGIKPLFENVNLGFEDTDKIGIIGANGSGKTTFLRVVAGARLCSGRRSDGLLRRGALGLGCGIRRGRDRGPVRGFSSAGRRHGFRLRRSPARR